MTDQNFTDFLINKIKNDKEFAGEFLKVSLEEYSENANKEELLLALRRIAEAKGISELQKKIRNCKKCVLQKSFSERKSDHRHTARHFEIAESENGF